MTRLLRSRIIRRPLIAFLAVTLGALAQPREAKAELCGYVCLGLSCASDPHEVCMTYWGDGCQIQASCSVMGPFHAQCPMEAWYNCGGNAQ